MLRHPFFVPVCMSLALGANLRAESPVDALRPPAMAVESVPAIPPELAERLRQYQEVRSAAFLGWAPDRKGILIATRFADTAQLHRVYEPGGRREQITFFREPVSGRYLPKSKSGELLLSMSQGGNENFQISYLDPDTGRPTLLTDGKSRNTLGAISRDGTQIAYASNQRNGRDMDLYVADSRKPGSAKMVLKVENQNWAIYDFSPDGGRLAIARVVSINEAYPHELTLADGQNVPVPRPGPGEAAIGTMRYARDGRSIYLTTDAEGEFTKLYRIGRDMPIPLLTRDIPWDVEEVEIHPDRDLVAFTVNEDGLGTLRLMEGGGLRKIMGPKGPLPAIAPPRILKVDLPAGQVGSLEFSPDGERLGLTIARTDSPADAYSLDLKDLELTRWTYSEVGGLNPTTFVSSTLIRFPSFDEREIPAFYSRPKMASKEKPAGVLISIHGGPESQDRPSFSGIDQFFVNELGIAVLRPNVRGSSGYGKTYLKLDNAEKREDSVKDIGALLDWIAKQPELDRDRVAVIGGSYGGFMVLSSLTHYSDRIKAGVDIVGIASFRTFLENTSAYRRDLRRAEYGDERDAKMQKVFEEIDPLNHTDRIRAALLVAHGKNDPRVPFSEAVQIADKVRAQGREVWTVYADNEGHGFAKKANRDYLTAVTVLFLQKHLGQK